ncbi:MAG: hypothetical protein KBE65_03195 [Phycisphaerae bacterium]|nr:hypothetical protein [Phycisphaerae bacterium]
MKRSHMVYRIAGGIVVFVIVLGWSASPGRDRKTYEVETRVYSVDQTPSDATRAINANERLMERYMDMTERQFTDLAADLKVLAVKIDAVDARLTQMDQRLERIERHLGIVLVPARSDPNAPLAPKSPQTSPPAVLPQTR